MTTFHKDVKKRRKHFSIFNNEQPSRSQLILDLGFYQLISHPNFICLIRTCFIFLNGTCFVFLIWTGFVFLIQTCFVFSSGLASPSATARKWRDGRAISLSPLKCSHVAINHQQWSTPWILLSVDVTIRFPPKKHPPTRSQLICWPQSAPFSQSIRSTEIRAEV